MMSSVVSILCTLASLVCAVLLMRGWRATGTRLLFSGALCFAFLTVHNALLVVDLRIDTVDLAAIRLVPALLGVGSMLYGLIRNER